MGVPESYYGLVGVLGSMYEEVDGCSFYARLFPDNECRGEMYEDYSHPNAVYLYESNNGVGSYEDRKMRRRIMLSDVWEDDFYEYIEGNRLTLCSGLAYRGRYNRLENAQRMYALIFDLDGVGEYEYRNLLVRFGMGAGYASSLPEPTYVVASGTGLHVYYVFERPVDLFPNTKLQLKALKYGLTQRMWDYKYTSSVKEVQYQSINQTFRMVGSINGKYGNVVRAFRVGDRVTLDYLNQYVKPEDQVDVECLFRPSRMTRKQAAESYPEWYQRVVVERRRRLKKWDIKGRQGYALYEWWRRRVSEVQGGHRYYFLMCMVVYACKCDVPRDKLEEDMEEAYRYLRTVAHDNPLTEEDVRSALETYSKEYYNFTINDIVKLSGLPIQKSRRNGRTTYEHLRGEYWMENGRRKVNVCKANRELALQEMREKGEIPGRPSAENAIREYMQLHPEARKIDVARGTGKDKKTVYKYYDRIRQEMNGSTAAADKYPENSPRNKNGRPGHTGAEAAVRTYMQEHPAARKADVVRGTGLSKPTVYKYYDMIREEN
ncbi:MAG: hypothetical protein NC123_16315 [Butyrivibrio sp.]|nr:hypothetical protein [Butyrivibrio sp.]